MERRKRALELVQFYGMGKQEHPGPRSTIQLLIRDMNIQGCRRGRLGRNDRGQPSVEREQGRVT